MIEIARKEAHLSINRVSRIVEIPRAKYCRKVFGLRDYQKKEKALKKIEYEKKQSIEQFSLRDQEYGHKKIWAMLKFRHNIEITKYETYKAMKQMELLLPCNYTKELKEQMKARQQYLERFNQSQKYERIYRREYTDPIDAKIDLEAYRVKYNTYRPHEALGYDIPANYCLN